MVDGSHSSVPVPRPPAVSPSYAGSGHCAMGPLLPTVASYLEGAMRKETEGR